jgi:hypothetical protein
MGGFLRLCGGMITNTPVADRPLIATSTTQASWKLPDGARVYNSAAISVPATTYLALTFDSERYNNGGLHSLVTNPSRLTAQRAGIYAISGHIRWAGTSSYQMILLVRLNGTTYLAGDSHVPTGTAPQAHAVATIYYLAAGDYVELVAYNGSGSAFSIAVAGNYSPEFAIQWLGPAA